MKSLMTFLGLLLAALWLGSCATTVDTRYPATRWLVDLDQQPELSPRQIKHQLQWEQQNVGFFTAANNTLDVPGDLRRSAADIGLAKRQEALNISRFDEAADSSWFTNRMGRYRPTTQELVRGPNQEAGPLIDGALEIRAGDSLGDLPVLLVADGRGDLYTLTFDPKDNPELVTGAQIVSTWIFHTAGYNVPEAHLIEIVPAQFRISKNAVRRNLRGRKIPLTQKNLETAFENVHRDETGKCRAVATRITSGIPLGPFQFRGRRPFDKNDRIPHQHRRELRGYQVFSAWLNRSDTYGGNTMDMFIPTEGKKGYVKHYITNFIHSLGTDGTGPVPQEHLYDYKFDGGRVLLATLALGTYHPYWEAAETSDDPAVGLFESELFRPGRWEPNYPNTAFQYKTPRDGFWAAKIVMSFSDEDLRTIVEQAHYSQPKTTDIIHEQLKKRRDKIGLYWFRVVNPLDGFELVQARGRTAIRFTDLAVHHKFATQTDTQYRYYWTDKKADYELSSWAPLRSNEVPISSEILAKMKPGKVYILHLQTKRSGQPWSPITDLFVERTDTGLSLWGLRRRY